MNITNLKATEDAPTLQTMPSFDEMVRTLFKRDGYHNVTRVARVDTGADSVEIKDNFVVQDGASLMHAAIGIAGEAVEVFFSTGAVNTKEEIGDWLFYTTAMEQVLEDAECNDVGLMHDVSMGMDLTGSSVTELQHAFLYYSNQVLDKSKKVWIYGKPMTELAQQIQEDLASATVVLRHYVTAMEWDFDEIIVLNQDKLLRKRYPNGVYSDQAAQQRADKENGQ